MKDYILGVDQFLIPFGKRYPFAFNKAKGHWIWDINGRKYLDLTSGISVVNFGHANAKINSAVFKQMRKISHISNYYIIPGQVDLAQEIMRKSFPGKAFFCNSGAEANEAAFKISRIYGNLKKPGKNKILALTNSFHGRTIATISMTGQEKYRKGFEPLIPNIEFIEVNNIKDLQDKFDASTCAIFLEAVQGEGGIIMLSAQFVEEVKILAAKYEALIIFDEIQAGMGRTGEYFGYQNFRIQPDIITLAKAIGNGFPMGAVIVRNDVAESMPYGSHNSTFGGNYTACAAALATFNELNEKLLEKIQKLSKYIQEKLEGLKQEFPAIIKENRVYGLMVGIDLTDKADVATVISALMDKKIMTLRAGANVLRLLPPYTIGRHEIDVFCNALRDVLVPLK